MTEEGLHEIEANIFGKVQRVMFRDFVQRYARKLDLSGTVKNLPDGSVRVIAQGDRGSLEKLIEFLHKGSVFSRVESVSLSWPKPKEEYIGFRIIF
jgi:acylphosphatase